MDELSRRFHCSSLGASGTSSRRPCALASRECWSDASDAGIRAARQMALAFFSPPSRCAFPGGSGAMHAEATMTGGDPIRPMVQISAVSKRFGNLLVLSDINLTVASGDVCCLIGPSGAGKSTLIRCINYLEKVDSGRIYVNGQLVGYKMKGGR